MNLIVVVGARPNFIKIGPLMPVLEAAGIQARIAHTGQHYDAKMSDVFFSDLAIPEPTWYLDVGSGTHAVQTGLAMMRLEEVFVAERPDAVMVVGDVNSTLAGALAAVKVDLPIVHLEAGLRSGDMSMPEEINRLVTDQLSSLLLAPTTGAVDNLEREGLDRTRIRFVGNIMAQSLLAHIDEIAARAPTRELGLGENTYLLATVHRPENTDTPERLAAIVAALRRAPLPVVLPVHPRTRPALSAAACFDDGDNIRVIDPVGYLDMIALQRDAACVVTDSGGIQEEACLLHTPCVTVRRNTERTVTIEVGANRLVGADEDEIAAGIDEALRSSRGWAIPERWDDRVAGRVVEALLEDPAKLGTSERRGPA